MVVVLHVQRNLNAEHDILFGAVFWGRFRNARLKVERRG